LFWLWVVLLWGGVVLWGVGGGGVGVFVCGCLFGGGVVGGCGGLLFGCGFCGLCFWVACFFGCFLGGGGVCVWGVDFWLGQCPPHPSAGLRGSRAGGCLLRASITYAIPTRLPERILTRPGLPARICEPRGWSNFRYERPKKLEEGES